MEANNSGANVRRGDKFMKRSNEVQFKQQSPTKNNMLHQRIYVRKNDPGWLERHAIYGGVWRGYRDWGKSDQKG
jgi:hypothetical protein